MQFRVSICLTLLVLSLLCVTEALPAQVVWQKYWGGPYDDACEIRNTRDGGSILMATYGIHSWMQKLNSNGDTLWTRLITLPLDLCAVTETEDGGFLAAGTTRYNHRDILAWKFDSHGDSLWMRVYVDSLNTEGMYSIYPQPDNSFMITGYTSAHGYDMLCMHIDSVGNPIWRKAYGDLDFQGGTMAARTADGGQILSTTTGNLGTHIWVLKVDSLGDTVWSTHLVEPLSTGGSVPMVDSRGRVWIIGWIDHSGDYNNYIACLDSNGSALWTKDFLGVGFESRSARGIIEDRLGGYSFASSIDHAYGPAAGHDIAIHRIDSLGNVLRIHRLGGGGDDMPRYFDQAANGDYLICGFTGSFIPTGSQSYVARLAPNGCGEFLYDIDSLHRYQVCPGDSLILDAGAGFVHYLWSDGDTNRIRPIMASDTFYVESIDSNGCPNFSNSIIVTWNPGPAFTWSQSGSYSVQFMDSVATGSTLMWTFGDGDSATGSQPLHGYDSTGTYLVCLTATFGNCPPVTVCDTVVLPAVIGLPDAPAAGLMAFPNPTAGWVHIHNASAMASDWMLLDAVGKCVRSGRIAGQATEIWDLGSLTAGLYVLATRREDGVRSMQKLVVAK